MDDVVVSRFPQFAHGFLSEAFEDGLFTYSNLGQTCRSSEQKNLAEPLKQLENRQRGTYPDRSNKSKLGS